MNRSLMLCIVFVLTLGLCVTIAVPEEVMSMPEDLSLLLEAAEALTVYNIHDVRGHLTLPTEGKYGAHITWRSEDPDVITSTGEVTRPAHGEGDTQVRLTATLTLNEETMTKSFLATVRESPEEEGYEGYVFSYFIGEGHAHGEQIYFALSEGNDPLHWQTLNQDEPVITSHLGEEGLRDPFIIRSPEGDRFYMIATDLKIYGNWDWHRAQTAGSRAIMVWESTDLVHWSEQRRVVVSPPEAGNTWAPEIFYDEEGGQYVIFWASKLYENEEQRQSGHSYQRIMHTTTRDFHTFSEPEVYMDYGYSVIDTTMIEHDGKIYRITKDERANTPTTPNGKFVFQEVGESIFDPHFEMIKEGIGRGTISQGEGPTMFKSNTEEKWYLFIDEFGGRGYLPFETTDLDSGQWTLSEHYDLPSSPRHGTVLPITKAEHEALLNTVPREVAPADDEDRVTSIRLNQHNVHLTQGEQAGLEATITPEDADQQQVLWSSSDDSIVSVDEAGMLTGHQEGSAIVSATTVDGGYMDVAVVTVTTDRQVSIEELQEQVQQYVNNGDIQGPLASQLSNSLRQAGHHWHREHTDQAVHHLQKSLEHIARAKEASITEAVAETLSDRIDALVHEWSDEA
ncbi:immunoglobulin-like domain-containing protein [Caldalkalibacillus salinus]|uniref:immunoglobulin-like domain-containing protein n=1 Tax=Caldalkalibacillus salinus TaxID=2803787 RepID=UPI001924770E|nr:immunoglobulin-like domain-containing protein [Caldalkalibacillus salinus]